MIGFDAEADVVSPGNGFMVIDFGLLAGYTLTGTPGTAATLAGEFTESTPGTGAGLSGFTGNSAGVDTFLDTGTGNTTTPTDIPTIGNAVFFYNSPTPFASGPVDLALTLYTTDLRPPEVGNGFGDDSSGAGGDLSFSLNSVLVPSEPTTITTGAPIPLSWVSGGALIGLIAVGRLLKSRRIDA
jgi:hypothetical protein